MPRHPDLEEMLTQPPPDDDLGVDDFLDEFGRALTAGDGQAIAAMWALPAYVLSEEGARTADSAAELAQWFGEAKAHYNERGVTDTRPEIVRLDQLTEHIAMVRVHWPWLDAAGREVGGESSTYTLRRNDDGEWKFCAVVMHGAEALN